MVFSSSRLLLLLLLNLLYRNTLQQCPKAETSLPQFHTMPISLSMMHNKNSGAKIGSKISQYLLNLPYELLNPIYSKNLNVLISLNKMEMDDFVNSLTYRIRHIKNYVNVLVNFEYSDARWTGLSLNTILFSSTKYQTLLFDQTNLSNPQSRLALTLQKALPKSPFPSSAPPKVLTFLTGISMSRKNDSDFNYELIITDKIDIINNKVIINVRSGDHNVFNQVYVSYVLIYSGAKNYQVSAGYLEIGDFWAGRADRFVGGAGAWKYWAMGLSSFKLKTGPGSIALSLAPSPLKQSHIQISTTLSFSLLKIAVLQLSKQQESQCQACPQLPIIFNQGLSTLCVSACPEGVEITDQSGVRKCLLCNSQNGYLSNGAACTCQANKKEVGGTCVDAAVGVKGATNSLNTVDCVDPNSYSTGNGCQCKSGYSKQISYNQVSCLSICPYNSYFKDNSCKTCPTNTFADTKFQKCSICAQNCEQCKNQFACNRCMFGYITNSIQKCQQVCGDGVLRQKNGVGRCDDGNFYNGDGCSSSCFVQTGWKCQLNQGFSTCFKEEYQIKQVTNRFMSGGIYVLEYQLNPPPTSQMSAAQIQQRVKIIYYNSAPYQSYITNNPKDLKIIRAVGTYGGYTPLIPAKIETTIKLFNGQVFHEMFEQNIAPPDQRTNSKNVNAGPDRLS